ncbi:2-hydroxyacid dehydrogenase [Aromatoleum sp.]|uniref:2-hydroxyacid dehydrogenase n=1 Tax=Aromatoleum sp. TaxID=2307007 RepID=UPI002FCB8E74
MDILFHMHGEDAERWRHELARRLPDARFRVWQAGDDAPADYALVWRPPAELLRGRHGLKAVFNLGAGVDALLALLRDDPDMLAPDVPVFKLDDAGMSEQMVHYAAYAVLRHFRSFDEYARQQQRACWTQLPTREAAVFPVGVMGLGALGAEVAQALVALGFPVRGWARSVKRVEGVRCFAGEHEFDDFLAGLEVVVNLLPLTAETEGILDRRLFARLARGARVVNIARGGHLVEADLLAALDAGQLSGASLDVFRDEPLPPDHPFWRDPRIDVTPHVAARTTVAASIGQIAERIRSLELGHAVGGKIDLGRGY